MSPLRYVFSLVLVLALPLSAVSFTDGNPDSRTAVSVSEQGTLSLPPVLETAGYVPVLKFRFEPDKANGAPAVTVNGRNLSPLDRRGLPRLLNRKNRKDTGNGEYLFSLSRVLSPKKENRVLVKGGTASSAELFFLNEILPLIPDAPLPRKNALRILPGKMLKVELDGKLFISGENITGVAPFDSLPEKEQIVKGENGEIRAKNLVHSNDPQVDFRREAVLTDNGELELNLRGINRQRQKSGEGYQFSIPAELLDGADYEFRYGHSNSYNRIRGHFDFSKKGPSNRVFFDAKTKKLHVYIRYLILRKNGKSVIMDFSPLGDCGAGGRSHGGNPHRMVSFVHLRGKQVVFGLERRSEPEKFSNMVRIYAGKDDFYYRHGNTVANYYSGPFNDNFGYRISFASQAETAERNRLLPKTLWYNEFYEMPFQSAGKAWNTLLAPGWTKLPDSATHYKAGKHFPARSGTLIPDGDAVFTVPLQPGVYLASLTAGKEDESVGPFSVYCGNVPVMENITVKQGSFRQLFFSFRVISPEKTVSFRFTGKKTALNQLIIRNIVTEAEDYVFTRNFWKVPGLTEFGYDSDQLKVYPTFVPSKEIVTGASVTDEIPLDGKYSLLKGKYPYKPLDPAPLSQEWAWNLRICSIGCGNPETGLGWKPGEEFRALCRKVKNAGFNAIMEQGLFWYNNYDETSKKAQIANQKELNRIIHEEGLKVVRHADGPSFNTLAAGAAMIGRFPGVFPVNMGSLLNFQGMGCITNPELRNHIISLLERYVKETDCDGLMIDECSVQRTGPRCACASCRKKFAEETGYSIPMPEGANEFLAPANPVFAVWDDWRKRQDGDFYREMAERIRKIKPGIIVICYGVDFQIPEGRVQTLGPYVHLLGTEGSPFDDLVSNSRYHYTARKMIAAWGKAYGHAPWHGHYGNKNGLSYPVNGYLYWAFLSLHRTGLMSFVVPAWSEANPGFSWKGKMDFRNKESVADIAVFQRHDARDSRPDKLMEESSGISQMLAAKHIPHDFVIRLDALDELKQYKVLFLGNAGILSDNELKILQQYVENGGKLILSGIFGAYDEQFRPVAGTRFSAVTGVRYRGAKLWDGPRPQYVYQGKENGTKGLYSLISRTDAEVIARFTDNTPAILRKKTGKGECIVTPMTVGMSSFEAFFRVNKPKRSLRDPGGVLLLEQLLGLAGHTRYPVMLSPLPEKIYAEFCRDTETGVYYGQFLNMDAEKGSKPVRFRPLQKPVTFTVDFPVSSAEAASPDFEGAKVLVVRKTADGRTEITLPPELLKIYTLITMKP